MNRTKRVVMVVVSAGIFGGALASGCGSSGEDGVFGGTATGTTSSASASGSASGSGASGSASSSGQASGTGGASSTGAAASSASAASSGAGGAVQAPCQGHVYACGDLIDNDGDGLVDSADPDCLGPCDNTEGSYYGGIPGQNNAPCKADCYFDQDTGPGNDDCYWSHSCDPHEVAPGYYPEGAGCKYDANANIPGTQQTCAELYTTQSAACMSYCGPLTPNGCDCFGCCNLPAGSNQYVYLGSVDGNGNGSCDLAHVNDPAFCHPCEPVAACLNTCDTCELCIGKDSLPPECFPDAGSSSSSASASASASTGASSSASSSSASSSSGGGGQCPAGIQPCGLPGESPCVSGYFCITGCCQALPQ